MPGAGRKAEAPAKVRGSPWCHFRSFFGIAAIDGLEPLADWSVSGKCPFRNNRKRQTGGFRIVNMHDRHALILESFRGWSVSHNLCNAGAADQ